MRKTESEIHKVDKAPRRREFLKSVGLGGLGLTLSQLSFARRLNGQGLNELWVYVGTYTTGKSEGIYLYRFNLASGELTHAGTTKGVVNPSCLTLAPNRRCLYAVNEVDDFGGRKSGAVSAFAID